MPPFVGRDGIHAAPDGHVWVARTRTVTDSVPMYDVFDAAGRLAFRVALQPGRRVLAFGARSVYVVYRDGDEVEHLERYRR